MELRIGVVIMQRDLRTLLCVTALIGAMSSGLVYADDLTVTGTESHTGTYDSITVESAGSLTVDGDPLTSSGAFTNSGTVTNNYSIVTQTIQNNTTIEGTGNLTVNGVGLTTGTSLGANSNSIAQGNITLGSAGSAGLTFTNTGSITGAITNYTTIDGAGTANISGGSNAGAISQAVVNITGDYSNTGSIATTNTFTNTAEITGNNGVLNIAGAADASGSIGTNSGSITQQTITIGNSTAGTNASFTNTGTMEGAITNYGALSGNGTLNLSGGSNSGSLEQVAISVSGNYSNTGSITANSSFSNNSGVTFTNDDSLDVTGTFTNSGTIQESVSGTNNSSLSINATNPSSNSGTITQDTVSISGGQFTNNSGASITTGTSFSNSATTLDNQGTITSKGTFTNTGNITGGTDGASGTLNINNGGSSSGNITQNNVTIGTSGQASTFTNSGTLTSTGTFTNNSTISGEGDLVINGGSSNESITQDNVTIGGTFTNSADLKANEKLTNTGTVTNTASIVASEIDNQASITSSGDITFTNGSNTGTITQNNVTIGASGQTSTFPNTGTITSNGTFTNYASITNNDATTGTLNIANGGTNYGNIEQAVISVTNGLTNNSGAAITAETSFSNSAGSTISNDGTINASGTFTNSGAIQESTVGSDNSSLVITAGSGSSNSGTIAQDNVSISGTLDNSGSIETSASFVNKGTITDNSSSGEISIVSGTGQNNGEINVTDFTVDNGAAVTNAGTMTITGDFVNQGSVTNQNKFNISGDSLSNYGIFTNDGANAELNATQIENHNIYRVINGANDTVDNIVNDGQIDIENSSSLTIEHQQAGLGGTINVAQGENNLSISGNNNDVAGTLNVGNGADNTILNFTGDIVDSAIINITNKGNLNIETASTAYFNQGDTYAGDLTLSGGNITFDNFSATTGTTSTLNGGTLPYYSQSKGSLNLINGSVLSTGDAASITGGDINVDSSSTFAATPGGTGGINHLDNLNISGTLAAMNSSIGNYNIDNMNIGGADGAGILTARDNQADLTIDVYGRSNAAGEHGTDKFIGNVLTTADGNAGTINIADWTLGGDIYGWDAPIDRDITLDNIFQYNTISDTVSLTATKKEVHTPIGWYQLNNHGGTTGTYTLNLTRFDAPVYRGQVTTLAQWMNQLAIDDMLFNHSMLLPSFKDEDGGVAYSGIMANRYAATMPQFAPYQYSRKDGGLWVKMYGTFETLQMSQGLSNVGNNAYGTLIGADFGLKELRNGWKFMPTAYIGYNGAHQYWSGVGAYQNGGQAGFLGTWYKNNFILGGLIYGGVYDNSLDVAGHTDNTFNYFAGAATKAAYNWRFHRDWVLQPNLFLAYNFFGQQNWHSAYGQMGMMSGILNGINLAPGLNLIWEKETFSIYATLQYMYNLNGAVGGRAGNVGLPHLYMDRGYIQYGLGFTKRFTDRFSGYFQTVFRNVGRTGVGFQLGFNLLLGK